MIASKSREIGLGPASGPDATPLADARDLAVALRLKVKGGIDPLAERDRAAPEALVAAQAAKAAGVTFREAANIHLKANRDCWRNAKHKQQ